MSDDMQRPCTAFEGTEMLASGPLSEVAPVVLARAGADASARACLVFDDASGKIVDLDPRAWQGGEAAPRGRGRPRLGVVAREVTLLARHWDWLAAQPGGASATLRRLVDAARKADTGEAAAREAAYRVIHALGGDLPGFEEATRALFAADLDGFAARMADWPEALRTYALRLARGA